MRMIDEDEIALKEKPEDAKYIKNITSKAQNAQLIILKFISRCTTYNGTVDGRETPVQRLLFCMRIIYNRPPSRQSEGCLLLHISSTLPWIPGILVISLDQEITIYNLCIHKVKFARFSHYLGTLHTITELQK